MPLLPHRRGRAHTSRLQRATNVLLAGLLATLIGAGLLSLLGPSKDQGVQEDAIQGDPTRAFCSRSTPPMVCAHGGETRHHPPNTREAFQAAIDLGVDCVEVDVARTSDGELVVLHIRELQQLMGKHYQPGMQVGDLAWSAIKQLRWPQGERVLRARDALLLASPFVTCVILDVKTYDRAGKALDEQLLTDTLLQLVHDTRCQNCLIWAKSDEVVKMVKSQSPGQPAGFILWGETPAAKAAGMHEPYRLQEPEVVGSHYGMVDADLVQQLRSKGKRVFAWTINDVQVLHDVLDAGVDAVVTNFPARARRAIEWRLARCGGVSSSPVGIRHDDGL